MTDILDLDISQLQDALRTKEFSSVELTQACLEKISSNSDLNAFIDVLSDSAMSEAKRSDALISKGELDNKPLCGIPIAVKDMILVKDARNTCASKMLENFIAPYDATAVAKLKSAGAIVIGKTNLDEFAMGSSNENSYFGAVKNPWNTSRVPGGSSGGSAAAVAARMVPGSLGTDTGGSIRQPASFCGVVGLKPTYGRVSRYGAVAFASSLDQIGPMGKSVKDVAILTECISGRDDNDSTSMALDVPNFSGQLKRDLKGLRIGIPKEYFVTGLNPEVESAVRSAITKLESLGMVAVEVSLPHTSAAIPAYYILAPAEASSNLARFDGVRFGHRSLEANSLLEMYCQSRSQGFGPEVKRRIMMGTYVLSAGYYDAYYLRAQKIRRLIANDFKSAFEANCDVIVCPTAPTTAFALGEKVKDPLSMYLNDIFTGPLNLAGLPGLSMPCGFDSNGLPIGVQLIGKAFDELSILQVAYAYEQATDWLSRKP